MPLLKRVLALTIGAVLLLFGVAFSQPPNYYTFSPDVEVTEAPPDDGSSSFGFLSSGQHYTAFRGDTVYVVWWEARNSTPPIGNHVLFTKSTDGGQIFGPNVRVNNLSSAFNPSMKVDTAGIVYVAYQSNADIYFSKSTDVGTTFTPGVKVNDDTIPQIGQEKPAIAVNSEGQIFIAWRDQRTAPGEPHKAVFAAASHDGGTTFSANVQVNDSAPLGGGIDIGVDESKRVYVIWEPQQGNLFLSRSDDSGQTFTVRTGIAPLTSEPSLAVGAGLIGVVWRNIDVINDTVRFTLHFSMSSDNGQTFCSSVRVDDDNDFSGSSTPKFPSLVYRDSAFYISWNERRVRPGTSDTVLHVWFSYLPKGESAFASVVDVYAYDTISDPLHGQALSSIAVNEQGKVLVAWLDNRYETNLNFAMHLFGAVGEVVLIKGDLNLDRLVTVVDVVMELNAVFLGQSFPAPFGNADGDCNLQLTPTDVVLLLNAAFLGNPFPCN